MKPNSVQRRWALVGLPLAALASMLVACGGPQAPVAPPGSQSVSKSASKDDQSRCEGLGADKDVRESAGPGAVQPNVRRVYLNTATEVEAIGRIQCREIDTNLDGVKDVARTYDSKGRPLRELADTNYDGKLDHWVTFTSVELKKDEPPRTVIALLERDTNYDGKVDETRTYSEGELQRVQRDANFDGKVDVFEVYEGGALQRIGEDLDGDGRVDRWSRDELTLAKQRAEAAEREKKAAQEKKAAEAAH